MLKYQGQLLKYLALWTQSSSSDNYMGTVTKENQVVHMLGFFFFQSIQVYENVTLLLFLAYFWDSQWNRPHSGTKFGLSETKFNTADQVSFPGPFTHSHIIPGFISSIQPTYLSVYIDSHTLYISYLRHHYHLLLLPIIKTKSTLSTFSLDIWNKTD